MKKLLSIAFSLTAILFSTACSKQDEIHGEFSFTYNGEEYHNTPSNLDADGFDFSDEGKYHINIYMPDVFDGEIYFDISNCAYMNLSGTYVTLGQHCNLTAYADGQTMPIDSSKVFIYQSGSLKHSISDCKKHSLGSGLDWTTCRASGSFDLTLKNKDNETIEITNGTFKNILFNN